MKQIVLIAFIFSRCGYVARDSEMIGQVKKVYNRTQILCPDWIGADISLGVMRNGVGSMSHEDNDVLVTSKTDAALLKSAADNGQIVKITYDSYRFYLCVPERVVTKIEILK